MNITYGDLYYTLSVTSSCDIVYPDASSLDLFPETTEKGNYVLESVKTWLFSFSHCELSIFI